MHCSHWRPHILCGLAVVLLSGCHWYSPYGYGYPGTYAPPGAVMPQQSFPGAPPGTFQSSPPALAPGGPAGSQKFLPPSSANPGSGANSAPLWNGNSAPGGATNQPVPKPFGEPGTLEGPSSSRSNDDENTTPFSQMSGQQRDSAEVASIQHADAAANNDPFRAPVPLDPASAHRAPNGAIIPYNYDRKGYSWLTGVVDYDTSDKSWHITYDLKPSPKDKLGGAVRLIDDERLSQLHDGDVVRLDGTLDYDNRDPQGKPQYRIADLGRYRPSTSSASAN